MFLSAGILHAEEPTRPNILLVLLDDAGFMDFGAYGGDAATPNDFYSSKGIVDRMIDYLDEADPSKPFFRYVSFQAIHFPIQVAPEYRDRYAGRFDQGWETMRAEKLKRAISLGLVPEGTELAPLPASSRDWESLSAEEQARWTSECMIDAAFSFERGSARPASRKIGADTLRVYADRPGTSARHHPGYVYVDLGEAFREAHARLYADVSTARSHFGCASWALDHLLTSGGSAYLPERIAARHVVQARLFAIDDAPVLDRPIFAVSRFTFENDAILASATDLLRAVEDRAGPPSR